MNIAGLVGALLPVFFVLALGYVAGKRNSFDSDQAAGLSKLAIQFALPATLFVSMTAISRTLLLEQGPLVLALILAHTGLFLAAWMLLGMAKSLRGTPAILYALMLATSATPVFGLAVLEPILGPTAAGAVGLVALAINLVVPAAVVLLEVDAAKQRTVTKESAQTSPVLTGLSSGLKSPLLWAPILGIAVVLAKIPLPKVIAGCFELIGSTTSGVAVFAVGLVLAAHAVRLSTQRAAGHPGPDHGSEHRVACPVAWVTREQPVRTGDVDLLQLSAGHRGGPVCRTIQVFRIRDGIDASAFDTFFGRHRPNHPVADPPLGRVRDPSLGRSTGRTRGFHR